MVPKTISEPVDRKKFMKGQCDACRLRPMKRSAGENPVVPERTVCYNEFTVNWDMVSPPATMLSMINHGNGLTYNGFFIYLKEYGVAGSQFQTTFENIQKNAFVKSLLASALEQFRITRCEGI